MQTSIMNKADMWEEIAFWKVHHSEQPPL